MLLLAVIATSGAVAVGVTFVLTANQSRDLAVTATQACTGGAVAPSPDGQALCAQAAQVQAESLPGPIPGIQGTPGAAGSDGRGIVGTDIVAGRLVVSYSDGGSEDVGQVVGAPGLEGPAGTAGRGITDSDVVDGRLVLTFSDGGTQDLGQVVGADGVDGRGIASTAAVDGRLIVTYTDGSTQDAGPLPRGANGMDGAAAPSVQSVTRTYSDGSVERCTRAGGSDTDPVLSCEVRTTPAPEPDDDGVLGLGG